MKLQYISFREISPHFTIPNDLVHILALLLRRKEYPLPKNVFSRIIENTGYDKTKPSIFIYNYYYYYFIFLIELHQYMKVIRYYLHMKGTWGERFIRKYFKKNYIDKINNYLDELEVLYYTTELCYKKKISRHYLNELFNPPVYSDNMLYLFRDHVIFLPFNYDFNFRGNIVSMLVSKYLLLSELIFVYLFIHLFK